VTDPPLQTVTNAARLLKAFLTREESLGVSELARRLGLGKSAVHRLLVTLCAEGLVEQVPRDGGYRLGLVMFELGEAVRGGVRLAPETRVAAGGFDLFLLPVRRTEDLLITAHHLYRNRPISALQAVWADPEGCFPWEQRFPDDITQPLACLP